MNQLNCKNCGAIEKQRNSQQGHWAITLIFFAADRQLAGLFSAPMKKIACSNMVSSHFKSAWCALLRYAALSNCVYSHRPPNKVCKQNTFPMFPWHCVYSTGCQTPKREWIYLFERLRFELMLIHTEGRF
jgi:hypothetical protein